MVSAPPVIAILPIVALVDIDGFVRAKGVWVETFSVSAGGSIENAANDMWICCRSGLEAYVMRYALAVRIDDWRFDFRYPLFR
jgi:hypothetical protein